MASTITSANATFTLSIDSVYPNAQQLQQFGVDDAFMTDAVDASEVQVGVDGFGVAGYIPRAPAMTIRLLASSPSAVIFEDWIAAMDRLQDVLYGHGLITLASIGRKYTLYTGALMRVSTLADARKTLQNREFHIQWLPAGIIPAIAAAPL